jgi:hypothetical protein
MVQARRTLVKSAPELWAELSDAEALGRRLEPLGEIRITRLEPQTTVAWEGERARGTVTIEPTGLGTRVTLVAESSQPEPAPAQPPSPAAAEPPSPPEPEPERRFAEPRERPPDVAPTYALPSWPSAAEPEVEPKPEPEPEAEAEAELQPEDAPPEPLTAAALGHGFEVPPAEPPPSRPTGPWSLIQRLTRRRRWDAGPQVPEGAEPVASEPPAAEHAPDPPLDPTPDRSPEPPAAPPPAEPPEPAAEAAEPRLAPVTHPPGPVEELDPVDEPTVVDQRSVFDEPAREDDEAEADVPGLDAEELDGLLAGVLEDLGAAHHRPFSRG